MPKKVATDGLASYSRAIEEELGEDVKHDVWPCTEDPVEQSHRPVNHRYHPILGFGEFGAAHRFSIAVNEVSKFWRPRSRMAESVSLTDRRKKFIKGVHELQELFQAA